MGVNRDHPDRWKADIARSVDLFNDWFLKFAPKAFRETRIQTTKQVEDALVWTNKLENVTPAVLKEHPNVLPMLRMSTCPPIARDRLIGLSGVAPSIVKSMELEDRVPRRMSVTALDEALEKLAKVLRRLADPDIFVWLGRGQRATDVEVHRAATIVADRLCGSVADPIVRNAQERRQLDLLGKWLKAKGYSQATNSEVTSLQNMRPGTFSFRLNVPVTLEGGVQKVNIPIDTVIMPRDAQAGDFPLLVEAKSAGDFTNVNKRRKEEAVKMAQLRTTYGNTLRFILFLCGYFDTGYLGYEAAEGIDWVWEHRIEDLSQFGI